MPNPMKIQPVTSIGDLETVAEPVRADPGKPVFKSLLRRLFDRPFPSALKNSSSAAAVAAVPETQQWPSVTENEAAIEVVGCEQCEPSSLCLEKMVHNFIEEINEKQQNTSIKCGRNRCNCFNAKSNDSSDDEADVSLAIPDSAPSPIDFTDFLKSMISCGSILERNLLADTSRIVEKNKLIKRKDDLRSVVADGLSSAGYDASICKSRWDKSSAYPAGEYEYIDVIVDGERVIIDVDFRSEFEIARSTGSYKAILQLVPFIFVGKGDRLQQIVSIVCEAARQSLKKKGMPFPPWRKAEYMRCKWLAAHTRAKQPQTQKNVEIEVNDYASGHDDDDDEEEERVHGELELIFGHEDEEEEEEAEKEAATTTAAAKVESGEVEVTMKPWHPPPIKPRSCCERSGKGVVTGLAFLLRDTPNHMNPKISQF